MDKDPDLHEKEYELREQNLWRPACKCGWRGVICWPEREDADYVYERHIKEGWR